MKMIKHNKWLKNDALKRASYPRRYTPMKLKILILVVGSIFTGSATVYSQDTSNDFLVNLTQMKQRIEDAKEANNPTYISIDPKSAGDIDLLIGMSKDQLINSLGDSCSVYEGEGICIWQFFWKPTPSFGGGYQLVAFFDEDEICTRTYVYSAQ